MDSYQRWVDKHLVNSVYKIFDETMPEMGFADRIGQMNMALDIAEAYRDRNNLMVEAGVGIGKSFGYLIPGLLSLKLDNRPIVIATSSIQLSEQLLGDVKSASEITGTKVSMTLGKGKTHYVCLERITERVEKSLPKWFSDWISLNDSGDRAKLEQSVSDSLWHRVNVERCKFSACKVRYDCRFYAMRESLLDRQVVILNQDLLLAHLRKEKEMGKGLLPLKLGMIIIDEAHNLEEKTRSFYTEKVTLVGLLDLLENLRRWIPERVTEIERAEDLSKTLFSEIWSGIKSKLDQYETKDADRLAIPIPTKVDKNEWYQIFYNLGIRLQTIENKALHEHEQESLLEKIEAARTFLIDLTSDIQGNVYWAEVGKKRTIEAVSACFAPKNIDQILNQLLFMRDHPVILTSATLCGAGDNNDEKYAYMSNSLGFEGIFSEPYVSPFPYDSNAALYIPDDIVDPKENHQVYLEQITERIVELCTITKGRALVLFTSKEDLEFVYHRMSQISLPFEVLKPLDGASQSKTIESFRKSKGVLLATGVFWEGVNIEGPDLSSVIITRLPFPVPDPVIEYKMSIVDNPMDILLPEMLVKLRQGAGRLIRSEEDRGLLTILDSRVSTASKKKYRNDVLDTLPIKTELRSLNEVMEFVYGFEYMDEQRQEKSLARTLRLKTSQ